MNHLTLTEYNTQLKNQILQTVQKVFPDAEIAVEEIQLEKTPDNQQADFGIACFPWARLFKQAPVKIAAQVAEKFVPTELIARMEAVGPYLNLYIARGKFINSVGHTIWQQKDHFGRNSDYAGQRAMVEYSSPNTNKPLHIGHVRTNLIGMSLARVLEFNGYEVIKANLVNDRGIHICKSLVAYQKWGEQRTPESEQQKGDHFVGKYYVLFENKLKEERQEYIQQLSEEEQQLFDPNYLKEQREEMKKCKEPKQKKELRAALFAKTQKVEELEQQFLKNSRLYQEAQRTLQAWEKGDPEVRALCDKMNAWVLKGFDKTYQVLGCEFDQYYFESELYEKGKEYIHKGVEQGVFVQRENGSIWVEAKKLKEVDPEAFHKIPLNDKLLLRGDGTSVYMTQDVGTAVKKQEDYQLDRSLYVVAEEQTLHFKILFAILKLLGFSWAHGCEHVSYGMVVLPKGMGKIKSREGTAVDADDLVAEMRERAEEKIRSGEVRVSEEAIAETSQKVALAALKFFILQVSREKTVQFNPNEVIDFYGDTGPYLQYTYARIQGIFRKAGISLEEKQPDLDLLAAPEEFELFLTLAEFPNVVQAASRNSLHLIANYLLELTRSFSRYYKKHKVINEDDPALTNARLLLCHIVAQTLANGMYLLGIEVVESM